jgi:DNA replication protein DnaC
MDVLLIDDWALAPLQDQERRDVLEILEDRYGMRSTIITSQLPPAQWHDYIGEPTLASLGQAAGPSISTARRATPRGSGHANAG